jgi:ABC-2 type transport system ATP-binding protein
VLFSSHQLDVVERLCDDLVVIAGGRIRAAGEREVLREEFSEPRYEINTADPLTWLDAEPGVRLVQRVDGHALFDADEATAQRVLRTALRTAPVTQFVTDDAPGTAPGTPTPDTRPKETVR